MAATVVSAQIHHRSRQQSSQKPVESTQALLWRPLPGPQTDAYISLADELFYGGAAGGGKSDLLLGLAINEHRKSLILRREAAQLRAIKERLREIMGGIGRFNENTGIWRGIPGGRILELNGCPHLQNRVRYQGRPDDLKGFDELPEFLKEQYAFIIAWTRTALLGQRSRVVSTGNPPTSALGEWVIEHWGPWLDDQNDNPALPGELRWFAQIDDKDVEVESGAIIHHKGEDIQPRSRTFIPASVEDNPHYLATGYKAVLMSTPEPLRSQLLYGDFTVGREDDAWQVIPTAWILEAQRRWLHRVASGNIGRLSSVGADIARGGRDKTVFAPIYDGSFCGRIEKAEGNFFDGKDTPDGPAVARLFRNAFGDIGRDLEIYVDVIGVGSSAYDYLREWYHDGDTAGPDGERNHVYGINVSKRVKSRDRSGKYLLYNTRAELAWKFREMLDPASGNDICLPPDTQLKADLTSIRYRIEAGNIKCESKEDIKARIGRSPDKGDAVLLGFMRSRAIAVGAPNVIQLPAAVIRSSAVTVPGIVQEMPTNPFVSDEGFVPPARHPSTERRRIR
jgi:hypothetical protein